MQGRLSLTHKVRTKRCKGQRIGDHLLSLEPLSSQGFTISPCFTQQAHVQGHEEGQEGQLCSGWTLPGHQRAHLVGGQRPSEEVTLSLSSHFSPMGVVQPQQVPQCPTPPETHMGRVPTQGPRNSVAQPLGLSEVTADKASTCKPGSFTKLPWQQGESAEKLLQTNSLL